MTIMLYICAGICWGLAIFNSYLAYLNPDNSFILMCALIAWVFAGLSSLNALVFGN